MLTLCQKYFRVLLLACVFFQALSSFAQSSNPRFQHLTLEDGLPNSQVFCMLQDRHGFIWLGTRDGLARYDGYNFKIYRSDPDDPLSLSDNGILDIFEDRKGKLWIGTNSGGLNCFDPATEQFHRFLHDPNDSLSLSHNHITKITEDHEGYIWVGTNAGGLNCLDRKTGHFKRYQHNPGDSLGIKGLRVTIVFEDSLQQLWVGTYGYGLARFDRKKEQFHYAFHKKAGEVEKTWGKYYVSDVHIDGENKFWMATDNGLHFFDPKSRDYEQFVEPEAIDPFINLNFSLSMDHKGYLWLTGKGCIKRFHPSTRLSETFLYDPDNALGPLTSIDHFCSLIDREGILWIGSFKGLSRHDGLLDRFQNYTITSHQKTRQDIGIIIHILEDSQGTLWIGSDKGLFRIEPSTGNYILYVHDSKDPSTISPNYVYCSFEDADGTFLISIVNNGLDRLDKKTGRFHHIGTKNNNSLRVIYSICKDRDGVIWLATWAGVYQFEPQTETYHPIPWKSANSKGRKWTDASVIFEDSKGTLWVGTNFGELKTYNRSTGLFHEYLPDSQIRGGKASITCIYEDSQGMLWIGTFGEGLKRFDRKTKAFTNYRDKDGLVNNGVSGFLEDKIGNLWISTAGGLSKFNPRTSEFRNYYLTDGLPTVEFKEGHFKSKKTGIFYLGTTNGLVAFHPDSIKDDTFVPPVYFTSFTRYNTKDGKSLPITVKGITELDEVTVSYRDDILTFEFAALSFRKTAKNQYAYKLEGFNDNWIQIGTKREVTFTHLDPGTYTLQVKGSNGDGVWNEEGVSLRITITPPWWAKWWAKVLYIMAVLGLLYSIRRYDLNRRLAKAEALRLKELDGVKTRLYANITHEFRTPLTIMLGLSQKLEGQASESMKNALNLIQRNGKELLNLINQMLNLSKLDAGALHLHMIQTDIIAYLKYLVDSHSSFAQSKNITLEFKTSCDKFKMDYDPEKLQMIISNLLSNAIKFNKPGGVVEVSAEVRNPTFHLTVRDTGQGVPEEKLPFIFDRFYQADDTTTRSAGGTGIGLALTKELVNLLKGTIGVQSQSGVGTIFTITLPISHDAVITVAPIGHSEVYVPANSTAAKPEPVWRPSDLPRLLIIEDNPDLIQYVTLLLDKEYQIFTATDGKAGLDKVYKTMPDIILCDVMMPEIDGLEVCRILKKDLITCHIPIIMLTAKADSASRFKGLDCGAEAYMVKPFNEQELRMRLRKLLEQRRTLQEFYTSSAFLTKDEQHPPHGITSQRDSEFLNSFIHFVEENLDDTELDITALCSRLNMSRSSLSRKVNALINMPASDLIRNIRLHKAAQLITQKREMNISEISTGVGFKSLGHFSKAFKKMFDCSPFEYRSKHKLLK